MLEILMLVSLTKQIGNIVEQKGYKSGGYKILTVVLWFGGEIAGAIIGAIMTGGDESARCLLYIIALAGAATGAGIAYAIANNLSVIGPSLSLTETEQSTMAGSKGRLPAPLLWFLWLMTNVLANLGWGMLYSLFNPAYDESLYTFAGIATGISCGLIAGFLQWLLLIFVIPNADRGVLAIWIPASILGWATSSFIYALVEVPEGMYVLVSIASGLTIGILQWLILRKYSKAAIWWIPVCVVDWAAAALFTQVILENISNLNVSNMLIGVVGTIASSIAIVFILKETSSVSKVEAENFAESGGA